MTDWILIIAVGGFSGISDVKHVEMTGPQCKAAVEQLLPVGRRVGAVCVGPNGETFTFSDVREKLQ